MDCCQIYLTMSSAIVKNSCKHTYLLPGNSFCLSPRCLFVTPSGSSISFSNICWSFESIGAIDMSRTARNWPQLFKCSFSKRKKFHTNLLENTNTFWSNRMKNIFLNGRKAKESKILIFVFWLFHYLNTSSDAKMDLSISPCKWPPSPMVTVMHQANRRIKSSTIAK